MQVLGVHLEIKDQVQRERKVTLAVQVRFLVKFIAAVLRIHSNSN